MNSSIVTIVTQEVDMAYETQTPRGPWNDTSLLGEFREAILTAHNIRRANHGSGMLKLCPKLNNYAQDWANFNAQIEESTHRTEIELIYGENLHRIYWTTTSVDVMANRICNDFYSEIAQYKFGIGSVNDLIDVDHFTQMVWYDTTELGVGVARGDSGFVYCVFNYNPKGNKAGEFTANVLPPGTKFIPNRTRIFVPPPINRLEHYSIINKFRKLLLNQHNIHRKRHRVPFVRITDNLNQIAQEWAVRLAANDQLDDSCSTTYGENVFKLTTNDPELYPSGKEVCDAFLKERDNYNYNVEDVNCRAGHFTQVVWKDTKEIGIGMQKAASGNVYVVVNYSPRGNVLGKYFDNIFRPIVEVKLL